MTVQRSRFVWEPGDLVLLEEDREKAWAIEKARALVLLLERKPNKPTKTKIELWPEKGESREDFMERCVTALTKCIGPIRAPRSCKRKWTKSERLGKKELVTREAIEAENDADLLIEPCGKACIACEGAEAPWDARGTWNEADHPRVPAGGPDGGQFGSGGGGTSAKPGKSKKPAKKEDFDKAEIKLRVAGNTPADEQRFINYWNEKVGMEPEEFKQKFLGGVESSMTISAYSGGELNVTGQVLDDALSPIGNYERQINLDGKSAYSAFFQLNKNQTGGDVGKKVLAGNVAMYEALGIEKLKVSANIDVGGYAWAKYGYVPDQVSWNHLRTKLQVKLQGGAASSGNRGANTMEADEWSQLSDEQQTIVQNTWKNDTHAEFLSSEEQNWRDSGGAANDAKIILADNFVSAPEWAVEAINTTRKRREDNGEPPIPYSNDQLFSAINLTYESDGEGRNDPEVEFDDAYLKQPQGYDEAQGTLPGIEPLDPASFLTEQMRDQLSGDIVDGFNEQADIDEADIDPPSYLAEQADEYQDEYWDQLDDRERLEKAKHYDLANIEIEPDEDAEEEPQLELPKGEDPLLAAAQSDDPKSIWKIADSARGKELLLGTSWGGVLNLKDPESMARFKAYVGKAK